MTNQNSEKRLLKTEEAANFLAISERKLWGLCKAGTIPTVKIGRSVRIDCRDLEEFIENMKNGIVDNNQQAC